MNNTLLLKGTFEQAKRDNGAVVISLPKNKSVSSEKLKKILQDLKYLYNYWANDTTLQGALVSVYYNKIAAKSNRIQRLLSSANNSVRGARFYDESSPKHLITHYVSLQEIEQSIREVAEAIEIIDTQLDGCVSAQTIEKINSNFTKALMAKRQEIKELPHVSYGFAIYNPLEDTDIRSVRIKADENMYQYKEKRKSKNK